ncbi:uncharacterized protein LOC128547289 [Mercenaria mercenaria]|uniref:uncharacterized protein LOC128547289 n=1 Tax=Mercenaria mercenaria TaxID=6596 RepID=UPI00234E4FD9|nr:uncharacterized protein LOC128547289 [Mercenaria mercenaria]
MADDKVLSLLLNAELDSVGFNKGAVKRRVEMYNKRSEAKAAATRKLLECDYIEKNIVGSRRDGIAMETSDTDVMQIHHGVTCSSNALDFDKEDEKCCLLLDCDAAPPGYAFLTLNKHCDSNGKYFKDIENAVVHRRDRKYLSSEKYMSLMEKQQTASRRGWFGGNVVIGTRKGPAIPKTLDALGIETDLVGAFSSSYEEGLKRWKDKERPYNWPSKTDVRSAAQLPVYVVAVGKHGTTDEDLQWRISFNAAEMLLVQSLNDSQTKVFVMMRLLAKHVITPVCPDITSYVVKNVVLHLAEQFPLKEFRRDTLIDRFFDCLKYLRNCIEKQRLPSYMNPERNLLHRKLLDARIVSDTTRTIDNVMERGKETLLYYLTNKMRPEKIRSTYPRLAEVKASLVKGNTEDRFAQKKVNAMTLDQLTDLHVHDNSCTSELMLFLHELYYVYRPYVSKYGFKALRSDLSKIRSKFESGSATLHLEIEMCTDEVYGEDEQDDELTGKDGKASDSQENGDHEEDPRDFQGASKGEDLEEPRVNSLSGQVCKYITVLSYTLLWSSILIMKFMMLNLFEVIHMLCLVSIWYSSRQYVLYENTYYIDTVGLVLIALTGFSFMQKRLAQMINIFYIALLISIWRMNMSYSDPYTLYFQELIVMLDPRQTGVHNFHKTNLDFNEDLYDFNTGRTMFV